MHWLPLWIFYSVFFTSNIHGLGLDKYNGYKVFRLYPKNQQHVEVFKRLENENPTEVEIMKEPMDTGDPLDLLASPAVLADFLSLCQLLNISIETVISDLPRAISLDVDSGGPFSLDQYQPYHNINNWLYEMQYHHSQLLKVFAVGYSFEGRPLNAVQISRNTDNIEKKPAIWLDAGIHANEWIGPATMLYFINQLTTKADTDPEIAELLDTFVFYILPVFNVDGYVFSWTTDRLWRKSRSLHDSSGDCVGVDMNRNWDISWNLQKNLNKNPCSRLYAGPQPFSEPETVAVEMFLEQHRHSIVGYLAYHSYSQYWMTPFGFSSKEKPRNINDLHEIGVAASQAIAKVHGTKYKVGSIAELVGETSGSSVDYTYTKLGIKYSFGVELRDNGVFGTLLPPDQIIPNAEESFAALKVVSRLILDRMREDQESVSASQAENYVSQEGRPF